MIFFTARSSFWLAIGYVTIQHTIGMPTDQPNPVAEVKNRIQGTVESFEPASLLSNSVTQKWVADAAMKAGAAQIENMLQSAKPTATARVNEAKPFTPVPVRVKPDRT